MFLFGTPEANHSVGLGFAICEIESHGIIDEKYVGKTLADYTESYQRKHNQARGFDKIQISIRERGKLDDIVTLLLPCLLQCLVNPS